MPTYRLVLEYNGARFHGWQEQPGLRTIQGELRSAIKMVLRTDIDKFCASGRTDAGVHARAQVVSFSVECDVDLHRLAHAISSVLRGEVAVLDAALVEPDFRANRRVAQKCYRYRLLPRGVPAVLDRGCVWQIASVLDFGRLQTEAKSLEGTHDFTSFQASGCTSNSPVKTITRSEFYKDGRYWVYDVEGSGFLKQMVRNMVGTLVEISKGRAELGSVAEVLSRKDRRRAGITAPPYGLTLEWVEYELRGGVWRSTADGAT